MSNRQGELFPKRETRKRQLGAPIDSQLCIFYEHHRCADPRPADRINVFGGLECLSCAYEVVVANHLDFNPLRQREAFTLQSSPDEIVVCPNCGAQIVVQRRLPDGRMLSEFRSRGGACFSCSNEARKGKR